MSITPVGNSTVAPFRTADLGESFRRVADSGASPAGDRSFNDLIQGLLEKVNEPQMQADQAFQRLVTGESNNVHDVVMTAVKADMSFRMVLELRNRLTDAYQEIMRMQV